MKKTITILSAILFFTFAGNAQITADFENLVLPVDSFYQDTTGADFMSGDVSFEYEWTQSSWGDYWSGGFIYSNKTDSVTSGYGNQYSAKTGGGHNSANYAVAYGGGVMRLLNGASANGFYITNSTYAYNSMRDGDMFAKKFGGSSGNDPDWFKIVFRRYQGGALDMNDSVEFYLADFRFPDNTQDYIVKTWEYVDLSSISAADSFGFELSSSDTAFGFMNTPAYFCMDDFSTTSATGIKETVSSGFHLFPVPATTVLNIEWNGSAAADMEYTITNANGKQVLTNKLDRSHTIKMEDLDAGIYFIQLTCGKEVITKKFIKH